jgi:hypothetical protein
LGDAARRRDRHDGAMLITRHPDNPETAAAGWRATRLAAADGGAAGFEVWRFGLEANATGPCTTCPGAIVVVVLGGSGKLRLASGPYRFQAPCTLAIAPAEEHQFVNLGAQALDLIAVHAGALPLPANLPETPAPSRHPSQETS